ncbi:MAG: tetratricopeptide repeat protein, partial [Planctomycetaceae bacterium]|nr:tetratricopeptide repeat protein [Planctomycetaceae bacterium]
ARLALTDAERLAGMEPEQRGRLKEAVRLNSKVGGLRRAGKYAEATSAARQALAIREAALGARHPDTAQSLNNLALLLKSQGDYAAAKPLYEQALAIRKAVLGARHPDTATSLNNLAGLLQAQGDYAGAKPLYEQALALRKAVLGARHPDTADSLNNLAYLLWAQGDYAAARPLYEGPSQMGVTRPPLCRISLVEPVLLLLHSELQEVVPLVVQVQRPHMQHRLGAFHRPSHPRLLHPVLDQMATRPLRYSTTDRIARRQVLVILQVLPVVLQVLDR